MQDAPELKEAGRPLTCVMTHKIRKVSHLSHLSGCSSAAVNSQSPHSITRSRLQSQKVTSASTPCTLSGALNLSSASRACSGMSSLEVHLSSAAPDIILCETHDICPICRYLGWRAAVCLLRCLQRQRFCARQCELRRVRKLWSLPTPSPTMASAVTLNVLYYYASYQIALIARGSQLSSD